MMRDTLAAVQDAMKQGKTLDQMKKEKILAKWTPDWDGPDKFVKTDAWIETIYNDLSGKGGGQFIKHN
jgi:hypothetical protein